MNFSHQLYLIEFDFINKFYLNNSISVPHLDKITIRCSIRNAQHEQTSDFTKSLCLIELISFQRSFVKNYKSFMKGRGQRQHIFDSLVSLRKNSLYNFLYFFIENVLLNLKENFLSINKLLAGDQYSFAVKDASIFPSIDELFIKWGFPLFFTLNLNVHNNKYYFNLVLRNFSFYTIILNETL